MSQPPGYYGAPGAGDPYGQQPGAGGPYGQPSYGDPYGQPSGPPAYGQPSGPPAGYGQPSGPPAGYGAPAGYPGDPYGAPPPAYGGMGGYPAAPPPKKKTGLWITLAIAGVVLLLCVGGGVIAFFTLWPEGGISAKGAVESYLEAARDNDSSKGKDLLCDDLKKKEDDNSGRSSGNPLKSDAVKIKKLTWDITDDQEVSSKEHKVTAKIEITQEYEGQERSDSGNLVFKVVKEDGWKICDMDATTSS